MPESTGKFEAKFFELLSEDMSVGGGALGAGAAESGIFNPNSQITSADTYAPGDARRPKVLGKTQSRRGSVKSKKKKDKARGINGVFLSGEEDEENVEMCPDACCGKPVKECKCGPDCPHCDCYEKNHG